MCERPAALRALIPGGGRRTCEKMLTEIRDAVGGSPSDIGCAISLGFDPIHPAPIIIPAKAGIYCQARLDSRLRGNDGNGRKKKIAGLEPQIFASPERMSVSR